MKNNIRMLVGCVVLLPQVLTYLAVRNSCRGGELLQTYYVISQ